MVYKANTKPREVTDYIAVHCSATGPKQDIGAADIDRWHRKQGWQCIGYHFVIKRDGTVEEGRELDKIGSHVQNFNAISVGICMAGGVKDGDPNTPENNFTEAQFASLKKLLLELKQKYPKAHIQGHRDFPAVKKACPSFDVAKWLKSVDISN